MCLKLHQLLELCLQEVILFVKANKFKIPQLPSEEKGELLVLSQAKEHQQAKS